MTLIINLFAGPGAGKSTYATGLYSYLKRKGYSVEYLPEFIKSKVWKEDELACRSELYLTGNFLYQIENLEGKVDILVLDSSLLSGVLFGKFKTESEKVNFSKLALELFNRKNNLNLFLERQGTYQSEGRLQTESEALALDRLVKYNLRQLEVSYHTVTDNNFEAIETLISARQ